MKDIITRVLFKDKHIDAGSFVDSDMIDVAALAQDGYFSVQIDVSKSSGAGTLGMDYLVSNDLKDFLFPTGGTSIFSGFGTTSGVQTNGKDVFSFSPLVVRGIQLRAYASGGTGVTFTATIAMH